MANKKISQLTSASLLLGTELVPIVQPVDDPKDNRKITLDDINDLLRNGVPIAGDDLSKLYNLILLSAGFKGSFDASGGGVPGSAGNRAGYFWRISVAGSIAGLLSGNATVRVGDLLFANSTGATVAGDFFSVTIASQKGDVGLGNVDNTSDANKPVSIAQAAADAAILASAIQRANHIGTQLASTISDFNAAALAAAPAETTITSGALINGATAKATPVDADFVGLMDSAASNILKKLSWANIKVTLKNYFDTLYQSALGFTPENVANKGAANGYAPLDGTTKIPSIYLPAYVDDVLEYANFAALPVTGATGIIYITLDTNYEWRWSGSTYIQLVASPGSTDAVPEGTTNKYFTEARVRATVLTSLSLVTGGVIAVTDSVLAAFGKLQKQITDIIVPVKATGAELITGTDDAKFATALGIASWWTNIKTLALTFTSSITAKQFASTLQTLTDAATITWDGALGQNAVVTLAGNRTLAAITNPLSGVFYSLRVLQDATGGRTLAFNAAYTFPGTITPYINLTANASTTLLFMYDGTSFRYVLPSNTYRIGDLLINNQAATSGKKLMMYIDDTGKIFKASWIEFDSTNQKITHTGVDDINAQDEWKNLSGNSILKINNDRSVDFGGTSAFWTVPAGIADGSSGVIFLIGQDIAYRIKDSGSFDYLDFKSTTTGYGRAVIIKQKQINDYGQGFETIRNQFKLTLPNTTAAATHIVGSIAVPSGYGIMVHVHNFMAFATNGNIQSCEPFSAVGTNAAGTTSGTATTPTSIRLTATTGGPSVVFNNTTDTVDLSFTNETGTGRQYDVIFDVSYIIYLLPV